MQAFSRKTAFITGGANGIGLATAQALLQEGMNMMTADIDETALDNTQIGASVLCPLGVKINLSSYARTTDKNIQAGFEQLMDSGIDPARVAARLVECIKEDVFYIFTHQDESLVALEMRHNEMKQAIANAQQSAALSL